jgi:hypothetical protein
MSQILQNYKNGIFIAVNAGTNPATLSYNASVVKIYSATNIMARLENKNYFSLM